MTARVSRAVALSLSVLIVVAAGWSFAQPYVRIYLAQLGPTIIDVFGAPQVASSAWLDLEAGAFTLKVPLGTKVTAEAHADYGAGRIVHPAFALSYHFGPGTGDQSALRQAADYREEPLLIDGRAAVLRTATVPGAEPYRVALYVETAGLWRGKPVPLELHGAFATDYQRALAVTVLKSLRIKDLPDSLRTTDAYIYNPESVAIP